MIFANEVDRSFPKLKNQDANEHFLAGLRETYQDYALMTVMIAITIKKSRQIFFIF
jgi:hypothetical protein